MVLRRIVAWSRLNGGMLACVDNAGIHNEIAAADLRGAVVQAGTIQHVTLTGHGPRPAGLAAVVPRQLPGTVRDFTGRADHVATLDTVLPTDTTPEAADAPGAVVITAIDGTGGIGKTTLAVWWAHRVQHQFPDGTLHVNLRGYGPGDPATPDDALDGFLRALGVSAEAIPVSVDTKAAMFRSLLAGRRVLLVLDNANHPEQIRPLLPGSPGCVVVVTSRDSLTGLVITDGAQRITLDLLSETEAHDLVTGILGPARAGAEPAAVAELVRLCARLPLALRIAATRIAASPQVTVAEVVTDLADDRARLDALSRGVDERTAVRAVFDYSYQRLTADQARLFRRLGLHPGPEISVHAAGAVADLDPHQARQGLLELADAHMITAVGRRRFRFHDLLRAYAAERAHQHHDAAERDGALDGLLCWYAHTAATCDTLLFPANHRFSYQLRPPAHPLPMTDDASASTWLETERDNLLAALRHAASHDRFHHTFVLAEATRFLSAWGGRQEERLEVCSVAVDAATRSGDRHAQARFHDLRGSALYFLHRWDEAVSETQLAFALAQELGDRFRYASSLNNLARIHLAQDDATTAIPLFEQALPVAKGADSGHIEAAVAHNLCIAHTRLGDYQRALEYGEHSLALRRQCGNRPGEAEVLHQLARAVRELGEYPRAIDLCQNAVTVGRSTPAWPIDTVAEPLETLAQCLHHTGRTTDAIAHWQEAAAVFDHYGEPQRAEQIRDHLRTLSEAPRRTGPAGPATSHSP
ncbi:ATP-binding protein [Actinocrispum wychmicini]|uniref:Putative ATPase n=1 Tax=Actinocrispum wychmicini TaxID=1213861 RepID=A0A4R2J8N2_9PSEU|nr:tetratricopeptide repeat protein [Actinocrispum wychmicini]TCO55651.1 putative ATPase [Actinocrispum wychmicini]